MELQFEERTHTYMLDDKELSSVTEIIKPIQSYAGVPKHIMELARQKGNATHTAVKLHHEDDLDIESLDLQIVPRFDAWLQFLVDTKANIIGWEKPMCSKIYQYAGMPDLWFDIGKITYLTDIKPNSMFNWYPIQLSGYQQLLKEHEGITGVQRATLQLKDDGKYKFTPYSRAQDAKDMSVFSSLLNIHQWRKNNGN